MKPNQVFIQLVIDFFQIAVIQQGFDAFIVLIVVNLVLLNHLVDFQQVNLEIVLVLQNIRDETVHDMVHKVFLLMIQVNHLKQCVDNRSHILDVGGTAYGELFKQQDDVQEQLVVLRRQNLFIEKAVELRNQKMQVRVQNFLQIFEKFDALSS